MFMIRITEHYPKKAETTSVLVFVPESSPDGNITRDEWVNAVMTWHRHEQHELLHLALWRLYSNEYEPWTPPLLTFPKHESFFYESNDGSLLPNKH